MKVSVQMWLIIFYFDNTFFWSVHSLIYLFINYNIAE